MLLDFFDSLRDQGLPVTFRELSDLISALEQHLVFADLENFYYLSRTCMIKDEKHFDKFDLAFKAHFSEIEEFDGRFDKLRELEILSQMFRENQAIKEDGEDGDFGTLRGLAETWDKGSDTTYDGYFGRNKGVGTAGTSLAGSTNVDSGANPTSSTDIGKGSVKPWDHRYFKELDGSVQLGTRNIKMAMRRLRRFARSGANEELDLDGTIQATAKDAGLLNIKMRPERHNSVKILLLFDIGGSMDAHTKTCEELFSAARSEFKYMEYFYFHNFIYDFLWQNHDMNQGELISTFDLLRKYASDYKVIIVGDAAIGTHEITRPGGSVDFPDSEPGATWLKRITAQYDNVVWLNPEPYAYWHYSESTRMIRALMHEQMYPMTPNGIENAMIYMSR
ncbi:MAG TPA: hypothetical protein DCY55_12155 [Gammaproteobacteria bacterium]|jgi:uncharacterized protein|nr:hypothetical protein [Gammaproteobacteria bacterium]